MLHSAECPVSHAGDALSSKRHCSHRPYCEGYHLGTRHWVEGSKGDKGFFSRSPQLGGRTSMDSSDDQLGSDLC